MSESAERMNGEEWAEWLDSLTEWAQELRAETACYELDALDQANGNHGHDELVIALAAVKSAALGVELALSPLVKRAAP